MTDSPSSQTGHSQASIERIGLSIFELMDQHSEPLWSKRRFYNALMAQTIRDSAFKTQLFRFVDVLPTLKTNRAVTRYLREYLSPRFVKLPWPLRILISLSRWFPFITGPATRFGVSGMAAQFITSHTAAKVTKKIHWLQNKGFSNTVDLLGEAVVSDKEADAYAANVMDLLQTIIAFEKKWSTSLQGSKNSPNKVSEKEGHWPLANLSLKISAMSPPIHPAAPEGAIAEIKKRLLPILRLAEKESAFVNIDMEHYPIKNLTLQLYRDLLQEPEFKNLQIGIAIQAYLHDTEEDLKEMAKWAREHKRKVTVRLVKGANWDSEVVLARQQEWPVPVFTQKAESDCSFERLTRYLMDNTDVFNIALGSHNVRSIAHAISYAKHKGLSPRSFELQVLYGMSGPLQYALAKLGYRVRVYCPVGELIPGMAYLVRRLLENTSNEGFLRARYTEKVAAEILLQDPQLRVKPVAAA